jgi:hypothetical protein
MIRMARKSSFATQLEVLGGTAKQEPVAKLVEVIGESNPVVATSKPPSREGKAYVGAWLPEAFATNILMARAKTRMLPKTIMADALNDWFRKHNLPVIDAD